MRRRRTRSQHDADGEIGSALATHDDMNPGAPDTVFVVHGEGPAATELHDAIERELGWTAAVPRHLEHVRID